MGDQAGASATTAATPASWRAGPCGRATRCVVLPGGRRTRIAGIDTFDGELDEAVAPLSITLRLEDDLDVARGELICHPDAAPAVTRELEADICWMDETPLRAGGRYAIKHTSRSAAVRVESVDDRIDVHTLERETGPTELRSTTSAGSRCARARRSPSTRTAATAARGASS